MSSKGHKNLIKKFSRISFGFCPFLFVFVSIYNNYHSISLNVVFQNYKVEKVTGLKWSRWLKQNLVQLFNIQNGESRNQEIDEAKRGIL